MHRKKTDTPQVDTQWLDSFDCNQPQDIVDGESGYDMTKYGVDGIKQIRQDTSSRRNKIVLIGILSIKYMYAIEHTYITIDKKQVKADVTCIAALKAVVEDNYDDTTDIDVYYLSSENAVQRDKVLESCQQYVDSVDSEHIHIHSTPCSNDFTTEEIVRFVHDVTSNIDSSASVYVDYTAGQRTSSLFMMMIMRILKIKGVDIHSLLYSHVDDFKKEGSYAEIKDVTSTYHMFDAISGVDEFVKYGNADTLARYFAHYDGQNSALFQNISRDINNLSEALVACQVRDIPQAIDTLNNSIMLASHNSASTFERIILDMVSADISKMLNSQQKVDMLKLIEWCVGKRLIQPALALSVEFLPIIFFRIGAVEINQQGLNNAIANGKIIRADMRDYRTVLCSHKSCFVISPLFSDTLMAYAVLRDDRNRLSHMGSGAKKLKHIVIDIKNQLSSLRHNMVGRGESISHVTTADVITINQYLNSIKMPYTGIKRAEQKTNKLKLTINNADTPIVDVVLGAVVRGALTGKVIQRPEVKVSFRHESLVGIDVTSLSGKTYRCAVTRDDGVKFVVALIEPSSN